MWVSIIISLIVLVVLFFGVKAARKKLKRDDKNLEDEIEKEFSEGKILLPIDKRDFENLKEFKEKTEHIKKIAPKLESMDEDFKKYKLPIVKESEEEKEVEQDNGK